MPAQEKQEEIEEVKVMMVRERKRVPHRDCALLPACRLERGGGHRRRGAGYCRRSCGGRGGWQERFWGRPWRISWKYKLLNLTS